MPNLDAANPEKVSLYYAGFNKFRVLEPCRDPPDCHGHVKDVLGWALNHGVLVNALNTCGTHLAHDHP
jgi:hypothetical protein